MINSIIKDVVGRAIQEQVRQDKFGMITVTRVDTVKNLDSCQVYVTSIKHKHSLLESLSHDVFRIQQVLNEKLSAKRVPKIIFRLDKNAEYVSRIEELIDNLDSDSGHNPDR